MSQRTARLARAGASLAMLALLLGAVPAALLALSRRATGGSNPLTDLRPPWTWAGEEVSEAASRPLDEEVVLDLIVRAALITAWIALGIVVVTTVAEAVHLVRHRGLSLPSIRGLGWAQRTGRFIALGLLLLGPLATGRTMAAPRLATAMHAPVATLTLVEERPSSPPSARDASQPAATPPTEPTGPSDREHVVARGESVYSIAADLCGGDRVRTVEIAEAILDANLGATMAGGKRFTNPAYVETGWRLVIPRAVDPRASQRPIAGDAPLSDARSTHTVAQGETLSSIAAARLGAADAWRQIWEANAGATMPDGRTFDDPNLIVPGWVLALPDVAPTPEGQAVEPLPVDTAPVDTAPVDVAPVEVAPVEVAPDDEPAVTLTPPAAEVAPPPADRAEVRPSATPPVETRPSRTDQTTRTSPASTAPADRATPLGSDEGSERGEDPATADLLSPATLPVRVEQAALMAAGVLTLVAVRRRLRMRRAAPRARVPAPSPEVVATERRLRTVDDSERSARVDIAIRAAAAELAPTGVRIGLVAVSPDGDVELRLTGEARLPEPWRGTARSWELPGTVAIEQVADAARRVDAPCVALVQIGVLEDGSDALVDLEACGVLTIEAEPPLADEIVTAVAAGLAASLYAEVAHLITVSLDESAALGHRNAHRVDSVDAALELSSELVGSTLAHERSTFELRSLLTGGERWEPAVVLLTAGDEFCPDRHRPAPEPGHGLAVVAATSPGAGDGAPCRLVAGRSGWELVGFDCATALTPVGLASPQLDELEALVAEAQRPLTLREERAVESVSGPFVDREHRILVGLLGPVTVNDVEGRSASFERGKTVELIAWLATHRSGSTRMAARTALWELDVRDATFANVVSEARRGLARLVEPVDDEEWLARTLNEQLPLHPQVVTDAELVEERMAAARLQPPDLAIDTLRPAVEMVRDVPFAGTNYLWPDAEGLTSDLILLATGAATELAAHALSVGDTELVFWATGKGLRVLPGHEELIGLRMRAHAASGDLAGVRQEWESYERVVMADPWSDGEPASKLQELRRSLLSAVPEASP